MAPSSDAVKAAVVLDLADQPPRPAVAEDRQQPLAQHLADRALGAVARIGEMQGRGRDQIQARHGADRDRPHAPPFQHLGAAEGMVDQGRRRQLQPPAATAKAPQQAGGGQRQGGDPGEGPGLARPGVGIDQQRHRQQRPQRSEHAQQLSCIEFEGHHAHLSRFVVIRGVIFVRQWTVDAFASGPFKGNPACIVEPLAPRESGGWPAAGWMQTLAAENNQAETAYLLKTADPARFGLRWFTPALEVPLCGHATLAAAHVLFAELGLDAPMVTFDTKSGPLTVRRVGDGYEMDFPANPPKQTAVPEGLDEALGATPTEVWAGSYLVAVFEDEAAIRALKPDLVALEKIAGEATGGRGNLS